MHSLVEATRRVAEVIHEVHLAGVLHRDLKPSNVLVGNAKPGGCAVSIIDWGHSAGTHVGGGQTPGLWMDGVDTAIMRAEVTAHPGSLHADFQASNSYNGESAAATVTCPTLVIAGQNDMMTPAKMGRAVASAIEGAEYVEYPGCGHFMMTERPSEVCRALARFLAA